MAKGDITTVREHLIEGDRIIAQLAQAGEVPAAAAEAFTSAALAHYTAAQAKTMAFQAGLLTYEEV